jgi:hypothetical protein
MLPLAAALALHLTPLDAPKPPPAPVLPPRPSVERFILTPPAHCPDIDPHFVRYVAPPTHAGNNPLLWWVDGPTSKMPIRTEARCFRPIEAVDR